MIIEGKIESVSLSTLKEGQPSVLIVSLRIFGELLRFPIRKEAIEGIEIGQITSFELTTNLSTAGSYVTSTPSEEKTSDDQWRQLLEAFFAEKRGEQSVCGVKEAEKQESDVRPSVTQVTEDVTCERSSLQESDVSSEGTNETDCSVLVHEEEGVTSELESGSITSSEAEQSQASVKEQPALPTDEVEFCQSLDQKMQEKYQVTAATTIEAPLISETATFDRSPEAIEVQEFTDFDQRPSVEPIAGSSEIEAAEEETEMVVDSLEGYEEVTEDEGTAEEESASDTTEEERAFLV